MDRREHNPDGVDDTKLGALFGVVACALILALTIMAFATAAPAASLRVIDAPPAQGSALFATDAISTR